MEHRELSKVAKGRSCFASHLVELSVECYLMTISSGSFEGFFVDLDLGWVNVVLCGGGARHLCGVRSLLDGGKDL